MAVDNLTIGFIGAGNMAYAIISGVISSGFPADNIRVSDIDKALLVARKKQLDVKVFADNASMLKKCDLIILAIKPQVFAKVCRPLKGSLSPRQLVISIAVGVKIIDISSWLGKDIPIIRSMPNTPALIKQGATGLFANSLVTKPQKVLAERVLGAVSMCFWVDDEKALDVVAALSGSGPAYFFLMLEAMVRSAVALGLDKKTAKRLSIQTALGASMMAQESTFSLQQLRANVTSKKGTTEAAVKLFKEHNFEKTIALAMNAAFNRAGEISKELSSNEP